VLLERAGLIDTKLSSSLARLAGFRNVIVHGYERVSLAVVEDIVRHRLIDLENFAQAMAALA